MALKIKALPKPAVVEATQILPTNPPADMFAAVLNQPTVNKHRSNNYTREKYFLHVSDIIQSSTERRFCAREHAINYHENRAVEMIRTLSPGMKLLHSFGHAAQDLLTKDFMARSPYGFVIWGDWKCVCGHTSVRHSLKPTFTCKRCQKPIDTYNEIDVFDEEHRIVGHPDLLFLWHGVIHIIECKSIERADVDFDKMEQPLGDHTLQATFYYHMLSKMHENGKFPYPVSPNIRYIYIDRSTRKLFWGVVYKEFVKRASAYSRLEPMFANAVLLRDSLAGNVLPARTICDDVASTRAKSCRHAVSCFSRRRDTLGPENNRRA